MTAPTPLVITHSGSFHADEVMAVALLEKFWFAQPMAMAPPASAATVRAWIDGTQPVPALSRALADGVLDTRTPVWVVRTRDASVLAAATRAPHVMVVDVGGVDDARALNFDHHQASMTDAWPDGTPYSSTGLVWRFLRQAGRLGPDVAWLDAMEERLIRPLDAHDNGVQDLPLAQMVALYNRPASDLDDSSVQFQKAWTVCADAYANHAADLTARMEAYAVLTEAWQKAQRRGSTVVVLDAPLTYRRGTDVLHEVSGGQADLLGVPGQGNRYSLISQPLDPNDAFSIKCPCPAAWRGRADQSVPLDQGTLRVVFGHKTGFMSVIEGDASQARRAGAYIVAQHRLVPSSRPAKGP